MPDSTVAKQKDNLCLLIKVLLEKGANVNAEDSYGRGALFHAVGTGSLQSVMVRR